MAITVSKKKPLTVKNRAQAETAVPEVASSPRPVATSSGSGSVNASSYVFPGICAIIATVLFLALLAMQFLELTGK